MGAGSLKGKGQFWGVVSPTQKHWEPLLWCMHKWLNRSRCRLVGWLKRARASIIIWGQGGTNPFATKESDKLAISAHGWVLQKQLHWLRCCLTGWLIWAQETMYQRGQGWANPFVIIRGDKLMISAHKWAVQKSGEPTEMPFGGPDSCGPNEACWLRSDKSICRCEGCQDGNVAFHQNSLPTCFL